MTTLKVSQIVPDKNQPRKYFQVEKMATLKDSIRKHGIISPLIVQKEGNVYLLIDGERRFRVAQELRLKEVPVQIVSAKNEFNRLLEQFHIQEQHAEWTATEKAMAILNIVEIAKLPLKEVCDMLSVQPRDVRMYMAFAKLANKERFAEYQVGISNAEKISEMKAFVRRIVEGELGEVFTKANEAKLERLLVEKIRDREITVKGDYSRIKDSFRSNPKLVWEFMKGKFDINQQFIKSNAKGARYFRNFIGNLGYTISNGQGFLREKSVRLNDGDVSIIKRGIKVLNEILDLAE